MPFRTKDTYSAPEIGTRKIKRPKPKEVAGPNRSESSTPSIRNPNAAPSPSKARSQEPFAVPSLPKAIKTKKRQLHKETQRKIRRLRALDTLERETRTQHRAEGEPHTITRQATEHGTFPPKVAATTHPRAYKRSGEIALAKLSQKENLGEPEDITHAIEIASLAGGAGAIVKGAAKGIEEVGLKTIASKGASAAESAATRAGKVATSKAKSEAHALRSYPARKAAKVKAAPARLRNAPKRARRAVATKEGRRAAAQQTARSARRHPVRSVYGAAVVLPEGALPGDATKRARAFAEGSAKALVSHPGETLETTGRSLAGAITGPAALLVATASSVKHGTPEPLVNTAEEQIKGVGHIVGQAFSGDTKKAEEAARKEGSLALATPLPALTRTRYYKEARGVVRKTANEARRKIASRGDTLNKRVRHSPEGTEPHVSGHAERHAQRKKTALIKQRIDNPHRIAREHHEASMAYAAAHLPDEAHKAMQVLAEYGARDPRHISDLRHLGPGDKQLHEALDFLEKHPEAWQHKATQGVLAATQRAAESAPAAVVGKGERARLLPQGDLFGITRPEHMVTPKAEKLSGETTRQGAWDKLAADHKRVKELRDEGRRIQRQAKKNPKELADLTRSLRSQQLEAAKLRERLGFRERRERLRQRKAGVFVRGPKSGQPRLDPMLQMQRERQALLHAEANVRGLYAELRGKRNARSKGMKEAAAGSFAAARTLEKRNQALYDEIKNLTHPERNIDQSKLAPYNDEMLGRYKELVEGSRREKGYAPAIYTHHAPLEQRGSGLEGAPGQRAASVEHMRQGHLALEDNLDRSFEGLVRGVAHLPRQREAARQFMRAIPEEFKTPFQLDGKERYIIRDSKDWKAITTRKTKENPDGGQVDPKRYGRLALREFNSALKDPFMSEAERTSTIKRILDEAAEGKVKGHEPSLLVPREVIVEARAQTSPKHHEFTEVANAVNRGAVRTLLGTNPAWFIAQLPAVAIPAILTNPKLLNPIHVGSIYKDILKQRRNNPEAALAMEGAAGAQSISSAALRTPLDMQEALTPVEWARGAKALTRGKPARMALSFAKLEMLGKWNAKFEGELRQVVYAMKADKQFRAWHKGVTGMFDMQAELSQRFRHQPREKLWDWLEKDPEGKRWKAKFEDHMDSSMGNWTAFTRYERAFAPLAIFYGFLRYSLRWAAWAFPRDHPVMATAAYMLAQANANQIDKLTGEGLHEAGLQKTDAPAKSANPLAYALPVYEGAGGKQSVLPGGSRISPGQSSVTQALSSGNPAAILSSANPAISAAITGLTGVEAFTGEKTSNPKGWAALEQITGLPYPLRAKLPGLGGEGLGERALEALGGPGRSVASQAYEKLDKNKNVRSGIMPLLPQTGREFGATEALSKSFDLKYGKGKIPGPFDNKLVQELLYGNNGKPKPELLPKVLAAIHASEKGSAKVKEAESPFYPGGGSGGFTKLQSKLLQAVEDAWKTGPSVKPRKIKRGAGVGGGRTGIGIGGGGTGIGGSSGGIGIGGPNGVSIGGP